MVERCCSDRQQPRLGTFDLWSLDVERNVEQRLTSDPTSEIDARLAARRRDRLLGRSRRAAASLSQGPGDRRRDGDAAGPWAAVQPRMCRPTERLLLFTQRAVGTFDIWTMPLNAAGEGLAAARDAIRRGSEASDSRRTAGSSRSRRTNPDGARCTSPRSLRPARRPACRRAAERCRDGVATGRSSSTSRPTCIYRPCRFARRRRSCWARRRRCLPLKAAGSGRIRWATSAWTDFDVSLDGKRFLAVIPQSANEQPLTVVLNWPAEVRR